MKEGFGRGAEVMNPLDGFLDPGADRDNVGPFEFGARRSELFWQAAGRNSKGLAKRSQAFAHAKEGSGEGGARVSTPNGGGADGAPWRRPGWAQPKKRGTKRRRQLTDQKGLKKLRKKRHEATALGQEELAARVEAPPEIGTEADIARWHQERVEAASDAIDHCGMSGAWAYKSCECPDRCVPSVNLQPISSDILARRRGHGNPRRAAGGGREGVPGAVVGRRRERAQMARQLAAGERRDRLRRAAEGLEALEEEEEEE